jgi:hypothetical protein
MGSHITPIGKKWREGKVRPVRGNSPHDRPVSRGISFSFWRICDDPFPATPFPQRHRSILRRPVCVFEAWRNLSGPMWFQSQNQTLGRDRAASRRSAPGPGKRTRREDHVPSHRPQMSSGRLFLDRVARQQSPSLLHRQPQNNTHSSSDRAKGDISTLPARGHFYFALTLDPPAQIWCAARIDHDGGWEVCLLHRDCDAVARSDPADFDVDRHGVTGRHSGWNLEV